MQFQCELPLLWDRLSHRREGESDFGRNEAVASDLECKSSADRSDIWAAKEKWIISFKVMQDS